MVEQVITAFLGLTQAAPQTVFGIQGRARHGQMHVGVKLQSPGVGVQHANGAGLTLELAVVEAELGQGVPSTLHQETIDGLLMAPGQATQFCGQREGDQEVGAGQQRAGLALDPALALEVLAVRAASVPAGVRHQALLATTGALGQHLGTEAGATTLHGLEGFELAGQYAVLVSGEELGLEAGDDARQRDRRC